MKMPVPPSTPQCVHVFRLWFRPTEQKGTAVVMSPSLNYTAAAARLAMVLLIVMLGTASGFAGSNNRKPTVVLHPRYVPNVPVSPYDTLLLLSLEPLLDLLDLRPPQRRQAVVPLAERALRQRPPRAKLRQSRARLRPDDTDERRR